MANKTAVQIESPGSRAAAYWFEDGLPEILAGLVTLGFWLLILVRERTDGVTGTFIWSSGLTVLIIVLSQSWKILDPIKARLTYSRTGYASPPEDPPKPQTVLTLFSKPPAKRNVSNFKGIIFIAFALGGCFFPLSGFRWGIAGSMFIIALLMCFLTFRDAHKYTWRSVFPIILAGVLVEFLDLPVAIRRSAPLLILGGWLVVRGTYLLVRFLRRSSRFVELNGGCL